MISLSRATENDGDGTLDHANRRNMISAHKECHFPKGAAAVVDGCTFSQPVVDDDLFDSGSIRSGIALR